MIVGHGFVWIFFTGNQRDNWNKGWNVFGYYGTKCLDFNKGWTGLGYLGVEHNETESLVDISGIVHVNGWRVYGLKSQWVETSGYRITIYKTT